MNLFFRTCTQILFSVVFIAAYATNLPGGNTETELECVEAKKIESFQDSEPAIDSPSLENQAELTECYNVLQNQLRFFAVLIEHLATIVSTTNTVASKNKTLAWLQQLRKTTEKLSQKQFTRLDEQQLAHPIAIFSKATLILETTATNNFKTLPSIKNNLKQKKGGAFLSLEELEQLLMRTSQSLQRIEGIANKNGLSSFNIFYRRLSQKFLEYQVPTLLFSSLIGSGVGVYIFSQLDKKYIPNESLSKIQDMIHDFGSSNEKTLKNLRDFTKTTISLSMLNKEFNLANLIKKSYQAIDTKLRGQELLYSQKKKEYVGDISLDDPCFNYIRPLLYPFYRIAEFLQHPEQFSFTGLKNCQALLLIAPPGYGKSFVARAAAGLFNKAAGRTAFIPVNSMDLIKKAQSQESILNSIIEDAKANAPCILWIDELHLLMGGLQIEKNSIMLDDILRALDTLNQSADPERMVFIIGATNRPDLLDEALLRHGRFSQIISLPQPNKDNRKELLEAFCEQVAVNPENIDIEKIAAITQGSSPSSLKSVFEQGHFLAKRENRCLETKDLYSAVNTVIRNIQPYAPYTKEEKTEIATRIAGATLYLMLSDQHAILDAVTIRPIRKEIQEVYDWMTKTPNAPSKRAQMFDIQKGDLFFSCDSSFYTTPLYYELLIAQYVSLELFEDAPNNSKEIKQIKNSAFAKLVEKQSGGISLDQLAKKNVEHIKEQAFTELQSLEDRIRKIINEKKEQLKNLQNMLQEKEFLAYKEINQALNAQD